MIRFAPLLVVLAALLWSADGLLRRSLFSLPPEVIVFAEHLLGALILLPILIRSWQSIRRLSRTGWIALGFVVVLSGLLGTLAYTAALGQVQFIQFSVVVLLQQLQPLWAILAATLILKESLPRRFLVWALIALLAAYAVSFPDLRVNLATGSGTLAAAGLALAAGFFWGTSTPLSKLVLAELSPLVATALRFVLVPIVTLAVLVGRGTTSTLVSLEPNQILTLLAITCSTGMVALTIYYAGLKHVHARASTILELAWPLSAVLIDYALFGTILSMTQIVGMLALILAMYQIGRQEVKNPGILKPV